MNQGKDFTQYIFNGCEYGKGRLVLAVLRKYVEDNPTISYQKLKNIFPDNLQSESKIQFSNVQVVFFLLDEIETRELSRFFLKESEVIAIDGGEIAVSKEWNIENIQSFIRAATRLEYKVSVKKENNSWSDE